MLELSVGPVPFRGHPSGASLTAQQGKRSITVPRESTTSSRTMLKYGEISRQTSLNLYPECPTMQVTRKVTGDIKPKVAETGNFQVGQKIPEDGSEGNRRWQ